MGKKIVINPITRISGFLEIEVEVEKNIIVNSSCSGMLFRGFEDMLKDRSPLDAIYFTERICGICSTAHAYASALALEDTLKVTPSFNDRLLREFIHGCEYLQNHIRHFYQYTLPEYVKGPDFSPLLTMDYYDYRLPDKLNKELAKHYIQSTKYSKSAHEMLAILGGKAPHNHGIFVGGVTVNIDSEKFIRIKSLLSSIKDFSKNIMLEDVYIISKYYSDYFKNGKGYGNFMSYGAFENYPYEDISYLKPKVFINGEFFNFDKSYISENIYNAWYTSDKLDINPTDENTKENINKKGAYSWIKAPRYYGYPMEVGPLARMWLSGEYTKGISTMDRTIARVLEVIKITEILEGILKKIELINTKQSKYEIPIKAKGNGLTDTTRGALGHWISIEDKKISNYTIITPTTWNLSPTDSKGLKGPVEKALIGTYIKDLKNPIEIGRIVRSFDPCVSCATHVISDKYKPIKIRLL
ncbi:MAG: Ni/Fe hydrogenase [Firmicutes bacterium]|nr:Ni/Fe hydrogenase [Bacillota bacterium]